MKYLQKLVNCLPPVLMLLIIIMSTSGCAKYRMQQIKKQTTVSVKNHFESEKLIVSTKLLLQAQRKEFLENYVILHMNITNKTNTPLTLKGEDITLELATLAQIKKDNPRLFVQNFIPCFSITALSFFFWWQFIIPSACLLGALGCQKSFFDHEKSTKKIADNIIEKYQEKIIKPHSSLNVILIINKKTYSPSFHITLYEDPNTSITIPILMTARSNHDFIVS
ncbi:MAG: hypothetical protein US69_C0006G0034 [candidate division TM6 bacterium GW2011_GWF2_38_10]|nr:MAG: hypothetical protein US69_C0006G0034 [candidate division TM6 bacterium GW2011_GWF2_38_10]